jgi:hypothetical protein
MRTHRTEDNLDYDIFGETSTVRRSFSNPVSPQQKESNVYFTQDTDDAIILFLATTDQLERNRIYNERIRYAFYKLAENIIHTFKFYYTDINTIEELKHEVVTFLLEKLHLYSQDKGKAYSYFGTIAKRYLIIYNQKNYEKLKEKAEIEEIDEDPVILNDIVREATDETNPSDFMSLYVQHVDKHIYTLFPKNQDLKTADAIMELFRKRESIEIFNKKALYIYIREITDASTPQITKITKKLKTLYIKLYNEYYKYGCIKS